MGHSPYHSSVNCRTTLSKIMYAPASAICMCFILSNWRSSRLRSQECRCSCTTQRTRNICLWATIRRIRIILSKQMCIPASPDTGSWFNEMAASTEYTTRPMMNICLYQTTGCQADRIVEAHRGGPINPRIGARNVFQFHSSGTLKYKIYCPSENQFVFVSNDIKASDNVVEAHPNPNEPRNEFMLYRANNEEDSSPLRWKRLK